MLLFIQGHPDVKCLFLPFSSLNSQCKCYFDWYSYRKESQLCEALINSVSELSLNFING